MAIEVQQIFVDGINHINFVNGMVRLGMGVLIPSSDATDNQTQPEFDEKYCLIMPLNSFLASFNSQKQLIDQLEAGGVISKDIKEAAENTATDSVVIPEQVK